MVLCAYLQSAQSETVTRVEQIQKHFLAFQGKAGRRTTNEQGKAVLVRLTFFRHYHTAMYISDILKKLRPTLLGSQSPSQ